MKTESKTTGKQLFCQAHFPGVVTLVVVVSGLIADTGKARNDNFYSDIIRLDNVATKIHQSYVEELNSEELVDKAVGGMLEMLDPHTSFFKKKQYEELRIHTEGKFGGLGIQISIRDKVLTVMTPISGTPASRAGIQSGDKIVEIEGKSTKGITIDEAVGKLRGEPGSEVFIKIMRKEVENLLDFTITREVITIKSVPFYGMLDDHIGYIRLVTFSQDAGDEVGKALDALTKQDIRGLILDLRYNPGGLLPQAIEVAEKFLRKKSLVVSTRGRVRTQNKDFYASGSPVLSDDVRLVVLANAASASASEIVAGAIQDWDRGIVLGDTTFGKGSVQSILPLDNEHHLKLTTAFYYTPSGRCINKRENDMQSRTYDDEDTTATSETADDGDTVGQDSAAVSEESSEADTTVYETKSGRRVYGGGGIVPDTIVEEVRVDPVIRSLLLKDTFFKFANVVYPGLQRKNVVIDSSLVIDDRFLRDFREYLDSLGFEHRSYARHKFGEFRGLAGLIDTIPDSAKTNDLPEWTDKEAEMLQRMASEIDSLLAREERRSFAKNEKLIRRYVREALLVRALGQDHELVYRAKLLNDNQVIAAVGMLLDKTMYESLLNPVAARQARGADSGDTDAKQ